jgi:membrane protein YdbS with pleckstrin-like domain
MAKGGRRVGYLRINCRAYHGQARGKPRFATGPNGAQRQVMDTGWREATLQCSNQRMTLGPRAVLYFMVQKGSTWVALAVWVALAAAAALVPHAGDSGTLANLLRLMALPALALAAIWVGCFIKARSYRFDLVPQGITLDKGWLSKSHETLLFQKVQDIVIRRSILERLLGVSTVVIQNAMGQPETIPGMTAQDALQFRDEILRRVSAAAPPPTSWGPAGR